LREGELAGSIGVSRTPVCEALRRLTAAGTVDVAALEDLACRMDELAPGADRPMWTS
jgi:DNA-binding GntR family transcriptional regulator